jgi:adenine C2-methylase RlmN of 23S rRNA A2503 and tRNA A37
MNALTIQGAHNNVTVLIPADQVNTLCVSDQVGIVEVSV